MAEETAPQPESGSMGEAPLKIEPVGGEAPAAEAQPLEVNPAVSANGVVPGNGAEMPAPPANPAEPAPSEQPATTPQELNPLDKANENLGSENSDLVKNIVATETGAGTEKILDTAPEIDASLLQDVAPPKSYLLIGLKFLFGILLLGLVGSFLFFQSQLTNWFSFATNSFDIPSLNEDIERYTEEVEDLKTDANFYRVLQIKGHVDEFIFAGDSYTAAYEIANDKNASERERNDAENDLVKFKPVLNDSFAAARDLVLPFAVQIYDIEEQKSTVDELAFRQLLADHFTKRITELSDLDEGDTQNARKNLQQAKQLSTNQNLFNLLTNTDFDALNDEEINTLIQDMNNVVVNDLSTIHQIKADRIRWSMIMKEIDLRTIAVDRNYNDRFFDEVGGIRYTSYEFDKGGPKVTISGETKRFDTANFTMISNLIDELNSSEIFENAEMRSFSKNGSVDEGYTATLKLSFDLVTE